MIHANSSKLKICENVDYLILKNQIFSYCCKNNSKVQFGFQAFCNQWN